MVKIIRRWRPNWYWCLSTTRNAGTFYTGALKSTWNIPKILKAVWQIFHASPAWRDDYISFTGSTSFPHNFCATRWVENKGAVERARSLWEHVVKIVHFWKKLPKSKQPKCDSYNCDGVVLEIYLDHKFQWQQRVWTVNLLHTK